MIYESSWEVCNKVGGIYTVLSTRANRMMQEHDGVVCFIGPLLDGQQPQDFDPTPAPWLRDWQSTEAQTLGMPILVGRWRVPGSPPVILVDYTKLYTERDTLLFVLWEHFGLSSDNAGEEYDRSMLFGIAAARTMISIHNHQGRLAGDLAIFDEWMLGGGLLYTKIYCPAIATMFITHATTVGRSIAGNGKELYAFLAGYDGDQMARELGVVAKHAIEKMAARQADVFATVSDITAREAKQLIGREPIVLPNGFEADFVPSAEEYEKRRAVARDKMIQVATALTGQEIPLDALIVSLGGRYEYHNKGIDVYLDALSMLQKQRTVDTNISTPSRQLVAFLWVPAWMDGYRHDLKYRMQSESLSSTDDLLAPLQYPTLTHWLHDTGDNRVMRHSQEIGLSNEEHPSVIFIFAPCYLNGEDGIFDLTYYDLLIGTDVNVYPSYYEPWGYTPMESIAFGIPAITTDLSGFGLWAKQRKEYKEGCGPVYVLPRQDETYDQVVRQTADILGSLLAETADDAIRMRRKQEAKSVAEEASWSHFYDFYLDAFAKMRG